MYLSKFKKLVMKTVIGKFKNGSLININENKPEYGSVMVIQTTPTLSDKGFSNNNTRIGFIAGKVTELESLKLVEGANVSDYYGDVKIIHIDSTEREPGMREKINPKTGETITVNGKQVYWKTQVVSADSELKDIKLVSDTARVDTKEAISSDFNKEEE